MIEPLRVHGHMEGFYPVTFYLERRGHEAVFYRPDFFHNYRLSNFFICLKAGVKLFYSLPNGLAKFFFAFLFPTFRRYNQSYGLRNTRTYHAYLVYIVIFKQLKLYGGRRNVFSFICFELVFYPAGNAQKTIVIELANISGFQEAKSSVNISAVFSGSL